jgi:hypothetical protein
MKMTGFGLISIILMVITGCSGTQLAMTEAMSDPGKLAPGNSAILQVKVDDPLGVVSDVTATVREYPEIVLDLNDNGENGDKIAKDGVWSYHIDVPDDTQAGIYNWDFKAYDAKGNLVKITNDEGNEEPLKAEATIEITTQN